MVSLKGIVRKMVRGVVWGLAGLGALVVGLALFVVVTCPFDDEPFVREVWIENADSTFGTIENPRGKMLRDLTKNHLQRGMRKEAVFELLGPPDQVTCDGLHKYHLGYWSGGRIDADIFVLIFDKAGKLNLWYDYQS